MLVDQKQLHPWKCDLSRGDVQCPYSLRYPGSDHILFCVFRAGHPNPHEEGYDVTDGFVREFQHLWKIRPHGNDDE